MSKLAKLQEDRLRKLKVVSSAGRNQRDDVLEGASDAPVETGAVRSPALVEASPRASRPEREEKRMGRPPRPEPVHQRTVSFTDELLRQLEALATRSGKRGFKRPGFSETVRAALRLWASHEWTNEEVRAAFEIEMDG
jgi:hypothetical protein